MLIKAREILGPSASVHRLIGAESPCQIEIHDERGIVGVVAGETWDDALDAAMKTDESHAWDDKILGYAESLQAAVKSLKDTAIALLKSKDAKLLTKSEDHFVRNSLRGLA